MSEGGWPPSPICREFILVPSRMTKRRLKATRLSTPEATPTRTGCISSSARLIDPLFVEDKGLGEEGIDQDLRGSS
jgi:hypothetical protein